MYQIITLGTPYFLEGLKEALKDYSTITFIAEDDCIDEKYPHLYLYYGVTEQDANYRGKLHLNKIVKDMSLLPIVKDVKSFND